MREREKERVRECERLRKFHGKIFKERVCFFLSFLTYFSLQNVRLFAVKRLSEMTDLQLEDYMLQLVCCVLCVCICVCVLCVLCLFEKERVSEGEKISLLILLWFMKLFFSKISLHCYYSCLG